ncbi:MAG: c-type cytochrome [Candidatus Eisenbacteria bacterium]|nr:c-type cytochrome [Candidatus Eisenbacteria bacterium]
MRATNIVRCAAVLLLGVEFMLLGTQVRAQSDTGKALPAHLANGQRVFLEYCAMCHGDGGQGDGEMAPQLLGRARVRVANLTDRAELERVGASGIRRTISLGGAHTGRSNLMPAWGERLQPGELNDVVDYVLHLPDMGTPVSTATMRAYFDTPPGTPEAGRAVFVHQCAACHGLSAHGDGPLAASLIAKRHVHPRNLTDSSYVATRSDRDLFAVISQGGGPTRKSTYMPHWGGFLTPAQIKDLVSYVRAVSHTRARP